MNAEKTICGTIFADADGNVCACEIELDAPTDAEVRANEFMVFPFPVKHPGPHRGGLIVDQDECH